MPDRADAKDLGGLAVLKTLGNRASNDCHTDNLSVFRNRDRKEPPKRGSVVAMMPPNEAPGRSNGAGAQF